MKRRVQEWLLGSSEDLEDFFFAQEVVQAIHNDLRSIEDQCIAFAIILGYSHKEIARLTSAKTKQIHQVKAYLRRLVGLLQQPKGGVE